MSATSYENVLVFRSGMRQDLPESILGRAKVEIDEVGERSTITIEAGKELTGFLMIGTLRSFDLNTVVLNADPEKAKACWSRQP